MNIVFRVSVTKIATGHLFEYCGDHIDKSGNYDFSRGDVSKVPVEMSFRIDEGSVSRIAFALPAEHAFWACARDAAGPDLCPPGPFKGTQFHAFRLSPDGRTLSFSNRNNNGVRYRYALRCMLEGAVVIDDPDGLNGGSGGPP